MKSFRLTPCAAAVAIATLQMAAPAQAANCTLTTNGLWQTTTDWSCLARPGANDTATINVGGLVTINQAEQITTLSNAGTINIDAFLLSLLGGGSTTNTGTINVGGAATAALQVSNNINNAGGVINVGNGSVINQFGTTITGGTINTTGTGKLAPSNSSNNVLSNVTVNGLIDLASATGSERIVNNLALNGSVNINNNSILSFEGTNTLSGNATVTFGNTGASNRLGIDNSGVLTTGAGTLIHGQNGTIGQAIYIGGASTLNNGGTISADVSGGSINLVATQTNNSNTLFAQNGGQLVLSGAVTQTASGLIKTSGAGSQIYQNGVTVSGGTIDTTAGGTFLASGSGNNYLSNVTIKGGLDLASASASERVTGTTTLVSGANIAVNSNSVLSFENNTSLTGNGTITFGNTGSSNRVGIDNGGTLTVGSGITIHGQNGTIGDAVYIGGTPSLVNNGTIAADVAGGTMNLVAATTNNGTLSASNGGTLYLSRNVTGNGGSSINAGAGSSVIQNGVTVSGAINTTGSGNFTATGSGNNYLSGVTLNGSLDLASASASERVVGNLVLVSGSNIAVNNNSVLSFEGNNTLSGNGTITLGSTGSSNRVGIDNSGTLTIGSGITIHGQNGTIGNAIYIGGTPSLINGGTIAADVAGGQINLVAGTTNNGVLSATNGGTLVLSANVTGNSGSSINSGAGSTVLQNGVTISGQINTTGSGIFTATASGNNYLSGVTLTGNLDLASANASERVVGNLNLVGASNIAVNNNSVLSFEGTNTLSGNGTITLGNTGSSNRVGIDNSGVLTTGANTLIHGQNGTIGNAIYIGGPSTLNNGGTISADVATGSIALVATMTNNSNTLSAKNGGQLVLSGNVDQTSAGHIDAIGSGSQVYQNAVTVTGGTINGTGGGGFTASSSGSNYLSGVTVNGLLDLASASASERIVNGLTLGSTATVNVNSNSVLSFEGNNTLSGTGVINLGSTGSSNRIGIDNSGTLTIASGATIQGTNGTIGQAIYIGGPSTLANNGTISADTSGGLITIVATTVNNNGLLRANGGTLTVNNAFNGTGTAQTVGTGQLNVGQSSTVGTLLNNGTTANALNLGASNITVSSDYNNANFGTGNAFNRRANVTGTGQILASGDASQVVLGSTVTNGGTGNPTLTIGNVHVGATTVNYQVGNAGTTGPAIRGAIQTTVNGGNISDSRLSGSGVTAGNFGPVATGSNTGNLGVTFTTNAAGVLAPLTNQKVHIANNFDNLAEQTLNIVLASGAAAYNYAAGSVTPSPVTIGNQRIGGTSSQALTVSNNAPNGAFSERLNASFGANGGAATNNNGSASLIAAGGSNTGALAVGINTASAGAKSGTVTVNFQSDGAGTSNLGQTSVGSQTINVSGNVYQTAAGNIVTAPYNFGTVQVNTVVSRNLTIQNTATGPTGFVEDLNASFGSATDARLSGTGSIAGLAAGSTSNAMTVNVNTSSAGVVNGTIGVNYFTAGTVGGVSNGLGVAAAGSQNYGVQGTIQTVANVVDQANPVINTAQPIALGNVRINATSPTATVSVTNQATGNQQAALNASIAGNAPITASGSFNLLAPGATNNTSLMVGMNTSTAGAKNGNATISFVSDASNIGNCAPNCQVNLASQNVAVSGAVYRLANPVAPSAPITVAARVGDAVSAQAIAITNSSPDIYTEGLNVTRGATSAGFTSAGSITNLAAAGTSNAITVSLNTATAGTFSGTQALNYVSTGAGTTNAADIGVGSGSVALNGKVYTPAVAQQNTTSVNFGIVHVGDSVAQQNVSVTNAAANTGTNDVLLASFSSATGPFTGSGNLGAGLGAQQTSASALKVGLNTTTAGTYSGTATFNAASHDPDLADAALANLAVSLTGQVNNYASDRFTFGSGSGVLTRSGSTFTLDYGTVAQNSGTRTTTLFATNDAAGPSDLLDGIFQLVDANDFGESGFNSFLNLASGQNTSGLMLSFSSMTAGLFTDSIILQGVGHNASGYRGAIGDITLVIRGIVDQAGPPGAVPEPDSLLLLVLGVPLLLVRRGRKVRRQVAH